MTFYINNKPIEDYGGKLLAAWSVSGGAPSFTYVKQSKSTMFDVYASDRAFLSVVLPIDFFAPDPWQAELMRMEFEGVARSGKVELVLPDGFTYDAKINSVSERVHRYEGLCSVTYQFDAMRFGARREITVRSGVPFYTEGTADAQAIFTATVATTADEFELAGVTFFDMTAGDVITIDSETKRVLIDGAPDMTSCDIVEFPTLSAGMNTIVSDADVTISYRPTY